eukprot:7615165-Alexandrium_andersonii.AAC.1
MSASLVGSEMCIRDRSLAAPVMAATIAIPNPIEKCCCPDPQLRVALQAVSYTHLTLPTICSV